MLPSAEEQRWQEKEQVASRERRQRVCEYVCVCVVSCGCVSARVLALRCCALPCVCVCLVYVWTSVSVSVCVVPCAELGSVTLREPQIKYRFANA